MPANPRIEVSVRREIQILRLTNINPQSLVNINFSLRNSNNEWAVVSYDDDLATAAGRGYEQMASLTPLDEEPVAAINESAVVVQHHAYCWKLKWLSQCINTRLGPSRYPAGRRKMVIVAKFPCVTLAIHEEVASMMPLSRAGDELGLRFRFEGMGADPRMVLFISGGNNLSITKSGFPASLEYRAAYIDKLSFSLRKDTKRRETSFDITFDSLGGVTNSLFPSQSDKDTEALRCHMRDIAAPRARVHFVFRAPTDDVERQSSRSHEDLFPNSLESVRFPWRRDNGLYPPPTDNGTESLLCHMKGIAAPRARVHFVFRASTDDVERYNLRGHLEAMKSRPLIPWDQYRSQTRHTALTQFGQVLSRDKVVEKWGDAGLHKVPAADSFFDMDEALVKLVYGSVLDFNHSIVEFSHFKLTPATRCKDMSVILDRKS
ncbi:hypothetical protein UA08_07548 [Talaromyces atroroseus]|uniref:Uncharacterized protein n=1 Tax=Talaromyces atroroseus TaxID=1441469 RepID=A0A225A8R7_TALAT|nr:hypothetical protein UA08_07548 [Talaromyces atroroseus]OKL57181.1 hypothetical protein UA08_07548 [Talaromyces atroroseus]